MTITDLEALQTKVAKAQEQYEKAQAAAEAAAQAEQARRDARARQLDEQTVAEYDEQAHFSAIRQARQEFDRALAASPLGQAWIALKVAEARHAHAANDRNSAASRLGRHDDRVHTAPASNATFEELGTALDRITADTIATELDTRDAHRDAYITGTTEA